MTPGATPNDTSETATMSPYHFETCSTTMVGARPATSPGNIRRSVARVSATWRSQADGVVTTRPSVIGHIPPVHDAAAGRDDGEHDRNVEPRRANGIAE
ncbi:MAG: hypothetical protein KatS3mg059_1635 [Thermomicrobiales bacterium]|nr:MAG: hypothetical protein KatS3mg059_1635 [Thermomicrobiales bacterium]